MGKNYTVNFRQFLELSNILLDKIKMRGAEYAGLLCPLRGGFYICDYISRRLELPVMYINISSYIKKVQREFQIHFQPELEEKGLYLLCDDIYDSGSTIKTIHALYPGVTFDSFCLVSKVKTDTIGYALLTDKDTWVDFYWEIV